MTKTKGKGQSDSSDWPLFMPVTTYASTHLARAVPAALAGFRAAEVMAELLDHFFTVHRAPYQEITRDAFSPSGHPKPANEGHLKTGQRE